MAEQNPISFEQALEGLEKSAQDLQKEGTTLEDAMRSYEEGMQYYERCSELLNDAKQRISLYDRSTNELTDF